MMNMKISEFYLKILIFLVVKFSVYLNRLVFVMCMVKTSKKKLHGYAD